MAMSVKVSRNQRGRLRLRLYFQGSEWSEGFALDDTPENRAKLQGIADRITAEMRAGTFDYLSYFPCGNRAAQFQQKKLDLEPMTIRRYAEKWLNGFKPPLGKKSRYRNYKGHLDNHILPVYGDRAMAKFTMTDIRDALSHLVGKKGVSVKTAKNALNATLRAMFRDATAEQVIDRNPFDLLPPRWWPKTQKPAPDPFTEAERDEILDYIRRKFYPSWPAGYVFCHALFWTGARPSELTARKWSDLDLRTGKLAITSVRTDGEEGETKTSGSNRTIQLFPNVLELIQSIKPLRASPDGYIFTARNGRDPIEQRSYGQSVFQPTLTALKIRHRDFYHSRHTFISVQLTYGENVKAIADYVGNSPDVIWKHYAKWLQSDSTFGVRSLHQGTPKERANG